MEKSQMFHISPSNSSNHSLETPNSGRSGSGQRSSRYYKPFKTSKVPADYKMPAYQRTKREIFARRLPWVATAIGLVMVCVGAFWGYKRVSPYTYTKVIWYEDFKSPGYNFLNDFNRDVAFGSFGSKGLEFNTDYDNNSFVQNGQLHIHPQLADPYFNTDGLFINLTAQGRCTVNYTEDTCVGTRNSSRGSYFTAVDSARLTTKGKHSMKYGRIEVRAKLPLGNWFWPAIWMLPEDSVYGVWPASGEIDMAESRGNKPGFPGGGYEKIQSSIHMAPVGEDIYASTTGGHPIVPLPFSNPAEEFHTYGMDWTPQSVKIWFDDPIYVTLEWKFKKDPFNNFNLPTHDGYGNPMTNPWSGSSHKSAPFDQSFYLILNVAVGRGYFSQTPDMPYATDATPWIASKQIWEAREQMSNTWGTKYNDMIFDWIRMTELDNADYWENLPSALI